MKVLKSGNPEGTWKAQITCNGFGNGGAGCGAELEVVAADLFHTRRSFCGRFETDLITIECPECKVWTDFTTNQTGMMPQALYNKIVLYANSVTGKEPKFS